MSGSSIQQAATAIRVEAESTASGLPDFRFRQFDASNCKFPSPRVAILPSLGRASFGLTRSERFCSIVPGRNYLFYSRGRYALCDAYRLSGVGPDGALLVPAYHCRTMLDPAVRLGAKVILYPLDEKLVPNLASLAKLVDLSEIPVRALLLTHYFGFPQPAEAIEAFCKDRGITLVEDCSHALIRPLESSSLGKSGQLVVASPYKFYPSEDGGVLFSGNGHVELTFSQINPGIGDELRSVARGFRRCLAGADKDRLRITKVGDEIQLLRSSEIVQGSEIDQSGSQLSAMYDPSAEGRSGLTASSIILKVSNPDRIAELRQNNFRRWLHAVQEMPHCKPLFDDLPVSVVPYMFPLYIQYPIPHFFLLKKLGMPIWRWDDMGISDCPVATDYRMHLLHLPCHQSLTDDEMNWMIEALKLTLRVTLGGLKE